MIVLVSMRTMENPTYRETRDAISHDWGAFFARYGITPILIPNAFGDIAGYFSLGARGLLLTGGDNLGEASAPTLRDNIEAALLNSALERRMPIFGACRGLQMINRYFGGEIARALPEPHVGEHAVSYEGRDAIRVNSFHDQGVISAGVAAPLTVFAMTPSGVVEGFRHRELPITAIQWHPERPNPAADLDRKLITEWLMQCK